MFVIFVQNAALLITLSLFYGIISWFNPYNHLLKKSLFGVWFGAIAVAAMMMPFYFENGAIYDGRSVVLTLAGLWGGGITAFVSVIIAGIYRFTVGGSGVWAGLSTIAFCALTGLFFRRLFKNELNGVRFYWFILIGLASHLIMLASQLFLPSNIRLEVISKIWISVLLVFPVTFAIISLLFQIIGRYIQSEHKIREAESLYRTTLLSIGEAVLCIDNQGKIIQMNKVSEKLTGWKFKELKGSHVDQAIRFINEQTRETIENPFHTVIKTRTIFTNTKHKLLISKSGREIPVAFSGAPIKNDDGEISGVVIVIRDQTEEREHLNKLALSEAKYREREFWLTESQKAGRIGNYDFDLLNDLWTSSDVLDEILGIAPETRRTLESWISLIHPDHQNEIIDYFKSYEKVGKQPFDIEYKIIRQSDGKVRWVSDRGSISFDENNNPVRAFGTIVDITEKKNMVNELLEAKEKAEESERLKTAFLANMSHEIRTPLNGILGFTALLTEGVNLPEEKKQEYASIINKSGVGLLKIINDILDISKLETNKSILIAKPFDASGMLNRIFHLFEIKSSEDKKDDVDLILKKPNIKIMLKTDEDRLVQVFSNLLDNAMRFTHKGTVSFGVSKIEDGFAEFFVADTGIGISKEKHEVIFDRFIQDDRSRSYGGTGLGLSIVKLLLEQMGTKILLESEPGNGTTFQFRLPIYTGEITITPTARNRVIQSTEGNNLKILAVEDDLVSRVLLENIFTNQDVELSFATNGKEALELYTRFDPEMMFVDIGLPDINGLDVVRKIRKTNQKVFIIAVTAYAMNENKNEAMEAGCNDFIAKPIRMESLHGKINLFREKYKVQDPGL